MQFLRPSFYGLSTLFTSIKEQQNGQGLDSVVRYATLDNKKDGAQFKYAIPNYADKKLLTEEYDLAKSLAKYEIIYLEKITQKSTYDKATLVFNKWIFIKADLDQ